MKNKLWQFVKFGIVGLGNTIISYSVYSVSYFCFHTSVHVANVMGFLLSVLFAYFMQKKYVFNETTCEKQQKWWKILIKTYLSYAFTGLILTELLLILWLNVIDISQYLSIFVEALNKLGFEKNANDLAVVVAPFLNIFFTIPINFIINKFWAYKQR